jgi:hypothetical protein
MISFKYLPSTLNTLYNSKEHRANNQYYSHPEPLHTLSVIKPPLLERPWLRIVEILFQYYKAVVPELEVVDLPVF